MVGKVYLVSLLKWTSWVETLSPGTNRSIPPRKIFGFTYRGLGPCLLGDLLRYGPRDMGCETRYDEDNRVSCEIGTAVAET